MMQKSEDEFEQRKDACRKLKNDKEISLQPKERLLNCYVIKTLLYASEY